MKRGPDRRAACLANLACAPLTAAPTLAKPRTAPTPPSPPTPPQPLQPPISAGALPFFLRASPGQRFCMYYPPAQGRARRGALLYVHPFGAELANSRRMAALQARAFAAAGYAVLQIDLYGCGDSSGDFAAARWHIWKHDLLLACEWLVRQERGPVSLWGLRLGCLLVLDLARHAPVPPQHMILWHPVLHGKNHLHQLLGQGPGPADDDGGVRDHGRGGQRAARAAWLVQQLAAGLPVELGGYTLAPELAAAITLQTAAQAVPDCPVLWLEQAAPGGVDGGADAALASARHLARWRQAGVDVQVRTLRGQPFWSGGEQTECAALLAATAAMDA